MVRRETVCDACLGGDRTERHSVESVPRDDAGEGAAESFSPLAPSDPWSAWLLVRGLLGVSHWDLRNRTVAKVSDGCGTDYSPEESLTNEQDGPILLSIKRSDDCYGMPHNLSSRLRD